MAGHNSPASRKNFKRKWSTEKSTRVQDEKRKKSPPKVDTMAQHQLDRTVHGDFQTLASWRQIDENTQPIISPRATFNDLPTKALNKICDYILRNMPRDVNESVGSRECGPPSPGEVCGAYVPAALKSHPLMKTCRRLRAAIRERFYRERTFFLSVGLPDPGLLAFKKYLESFEGGLPYVRILKFHITVAGDMSRSSNEGALRVTFINGFVRVSGDANLVRPNPENWRDADLVRELAWPWLQALGSRIAEQRRTIERIWGQPEGGWVELREGPSSYTVRF